MASTILDSVMGSIGGSVPLGKSSQGYVMALDAGTTSVRAVLFDEYGCRVAQLSVRSPCCIRIPVGWSKIL